MIHDAGCYFERRASSFELRASSFELQVSSFRPLGLWGTALALVLASMSMPMSMSSRRVFRLFIRLSHLLSLHLLRIPSPFIALVKLQASRLEQPKTIAIHAYGKKRPGEVQSPLPFPSSPVQSSAPSTEPIRARRPRSTRTKRAPGPNVRYRYRYRDHDHDYDCSSRRGKEFVSRES